MSSDDNIPLDIWPEILVRLPVESLIRFRAVCKVWRAVIDDPGFVRAHTNNNYQLSSNSDIIINITQNPTAPSPPPFFYSLDLEALNFSSSNGPQTITVTPLDLFSGLSSLPAAACNGLVLAGKPLGIWNPLTHEHLELPRGDFEYDPSKLVSGGTAIGLGYDYTTDDYKAVAIIGGHSRTELRYVHRTHVYSLKSDSWVRAMDCPPCPRDWRGPVGRGVFVCGALHWLPSALGTFEKIIALDLGTEKYRLLQMPQTPLPREDFRYSHSFFLDVLGGCLVLTDSSVANSHFYAWVMKDYGDEEDETWIKLFSIDLKQRLSAADSFLRPVAFLKTNVDGKEIMQVFLQDRCFSFFMFDVGTNSIKSVSIQGGLTGHAQQMFPGTIFRLHDNCGALSGTRRSRSSSTKKKTVSADSELVFCITDAKYWNNADPTEDDDYWLSCIKGR